MGKEIDYISSDGKTYYIDEDFYFCEISASIGLRECLTLAQEAGYSGIAELRQEAERKYPQRALVDVHLDRSAYMANKIFEVMLKKPQRRSHGE